MLHICFLVSGGGGNIKFLHLAQQLGILKNFTLSVIADRDCQAITFAEQNGIFSEIIEYKRDKRKALQSLLEKIDPDVIVTTWAKIIDEETVAKYRGKMINLHYSLLPAFAGQMGVDPIKNAYEQNCQYIGTTCHHVDVDVDMGKIISQAIIKTDISIEEAITEVFRRGCLILLNSIMIVSDKRIADEYHHDHFDYSPRLTFDLSLYDESFWTTLSSL